VDFLSPFYPLQPQRRHRAPQETQDFHAKPNHEKKREWSFSLFFFLKITGISTKPNTRENGKKRNIIPKKKHTEKKKKKTMNSFKGLLFALVVVVLVMTDLSLAKDKEPTPVPKPLNNDYNCPLPTEYLSERVIRSLLHQDSQQPHTAIATARIHVNIDPNPGAPTWLYVADISGKVQQSYDNVLGTMRGQFWINIGGVFYSAAEYIYNMLKDHNGQYNNFCLHFSNESGVHEYYEGTPSKLGDNMVGGNYIKTKAMDVNNAGEVTRSEWFVGSENITINCITDFVDGGARATIQVCLAFQKVDPASIPTPAPASATTFAKRSEGKTLRLGMLNVPDYAFSAQANAQFAKYCPSIITSA
jgi:hypothetical protein